MPSTYSVARGSVGRTLDVDPVHRLEPHCLALRGDVLPRPVLVVGALDDLVVDVGDVRHQPHIQACPLEVATKNVVAQRGAAVAEVGGTVHRRAAQVDADFARLTKS